MEMTGGFSAQNWSRFHSPRSSDCSGKRGGQKYSESGKIGDDFACSARRRGAIDKWRRQAYSARQTGPDPAFQEVLTVVESGDAGGTTILVIRKFQFDLGSTQIKLESGE